jgi:hypothetical protein
MPNTDTPFGLRPIKHKSGAPYNGAFNAYFVPASYATALFIGDPVVKTGTSNTAKVTAPAAGSFGIGTLPEINKATAGTTNRVTGVIVGFAPDPDGLGRIYNPASTARVVYVCDDPDVVFEIQADGAIAAAQVGLNAVFIYTNAGSTFTGLSGVELDSGTTTAPATTVGFQMAIQRVVNREDNEAASNFTKVEVKLNTHTEVNTSTGI